MYLWVVEEGGGRCKSPEEETYSACRIYSIQYEDEIQFGWRLEKRREKNTRKWRVSL